MKGFRPNRRYSAAREMMEENENRSALRGAQYDGGGCQYLGTPYCVVKIDPGHTLRKIPAAKGEVMDLPKLVENFLGERKYGSSESFSVTLDELKEQIEKLERDAVVSDEAKPILRIKEWFFNPCLVARCMEVLDADEAVLEFNLDRKHSLIAVYAEKGLGVVAPLNSNRLEDTGRYERYVPISQRG